MWDIGGSTSHQNSRSIFYNSVQGDEMFKRIIYVRKNLPRFIFIQLRESKNKKKNKREHKFHNIELSDLWYTFAHWQSQYSNVSNVYYWNYPIENIVHNYVFGIYFWKFLVQIIKYFSSWQFLGIILVHDLSNRKSHQNLRKWLAEVINRGNTRDFCNG